MMKMEDVWDKIVHCMEVHLSPPGFQTFLSSAQPHHFDGHVMVVIVPNAFSKTWLKEKCEPILQHHFFNTEQMNILLDYHVDTIAQAAPDKQQLTIFQSNTAEPDAMPSNFNPRYSFDQFIVGHNNRFAHAASEAVSKAPAKAYNPLFIYGSAGLGKTHLMHAIGHQIKKTNPMLTVSLVTSEKFTNDLINSIKDKQMGKFRDTYRDVDVLLVDDIQFLAGKIQTQEEFFHTFNELHGNNKQIVLTSDRPPKEIPTLEERLRTRFEWGLLADIQPPELETRLAILRKKSEENSMPIGDDILHFIATQIPSNVREMEGALNRIAAYASLLDTDITLSIASNVIKDLVGIKQEKPLTIQQIKRKVSAYFDLDEDDICSKNRSRDIAYARQIGMYLSRELTSISLPKIGENFGKRDHTTVMHACDKIRSLMSTDDETKNIVTVLISELKTA